MSDDNLDKFPDHENLPSEFAALALPDGDERVIVINTKEERKRAAFRFLRPHVLIPVLIGLTIKPLIRWLKEHSVIATVAGTAFVTAGATVWATTAALRSDGSTAQPRVVAERIVTAPAVPPATQTVTATPTAPPTAPTQPPPGEVTTGPIATNEVAPTRTSAPPATVKPSQSARPDLTEPPPVTQSPDPPLTSSPTAQPSPGDTPSETPTSPGTASPDPTSTDTETAQKDCLIRVDLDPVVDVCVLS